MIEEATNKMRQDIDRLQKDFDDMDIEGKVLTAEHEIENAMEQMEEIKKKIEGNTISMGGIRGNNKVRQLEVRDVKKPTEYNGDRATFQDFFEEFVRYASTTSIYMGPLIENVILKKNPIDKAQFLEIMADPVFKDLTEDDARTLDKNIHTLVFDYVSAQAKVPLKNISKEIREGEGRGAEVMRILYSTNVLRTIGAQIGMRRKLGTSGKMQNVSHIERSSSAPQARGECPQSSFLSVSLLRR